MIKRLKESASMGGRTNPRLAALASLLALVLVLVPQANAAPSSLEKIRAANHEKYARIVLDLTDATPYEILERDGTLILELENFETETVSRTFSNMGAVEVMTITPTGDNKARINFDLKAPIRPHVSSYTPDFYGGHRIVMDIWPAKRNDGKVAVIASKPVVRKEAHQVETPKIETPKVETRELPAPFGIEGLKETTPPSEAGFTLEERTDDAFFIDGKPVELSAPGPVATDGPENVVEGLLEQQPEPVHQTEKEKEPKKPHLVKAKATGNAVEEARLYLTKGKPAEACETIQKNFPQGTWNLDAMLIEGRCLSDLKQDEKAVNLYTEILSFDPMHEQARLGLAAAQMRLEDLEAAYNNYRRLSEIVTDAALKKAIDKRIQILEHKLGRAAH